MLKVQIDVICEREMVEEQCRQTGATLLEWVEDGPAGWPVATVEGSGSQLHHTLVDNNFYFDNDEDAAEYLSDNIMP